MFNFHSDLTGAGGICRTKSRCANKRARTNNNSIFPRFEVDMMLLFVVSKGDVPFCRTVVIVSKVEFHFYSSLIVCTLRHSSIRVVVAVRGSRPYVIACIEEGDIVILKRVPHSFFLSRKIAFSK